ncbi:hypothetical protein Tco_0798484 [Tanacetum coccineum]
MPRATTTDISLTKSYIPKVSKIPGISPTIAKFYKSIENRNIHEGRVVDQAYYKSNNIERLFTNIRFDCLFKINEPIVPRFILDFYSQVTLLSIPVKSSKIPYNVQANYYNEWDLASLEYSQETEGPYSTDLPTPDDIRRLLELERVMEELIRENVFGLVGHQDHLPACLAHMLYCVVAEEQYDLAYFFAKRIKCARANPTANFHMGTPFRSHPIFSSSRTSSQSTDDDDDVKTSHASTPYPTTYLNSLNPLNYQNYEMPSASEQTDETLFERQTTLLNQTQEMHKEMRGGFKSFGKALKGVFSKKKK